ncbi:hypothetical protein HZS_2491, partial [Henneguya salminicola]
PEQSQKERKHVQAQSREFDGITSQNYYDEHFQNSDINQRKKYENVENINLDNYLWGLSLKKQKCIQEEYEPFNSTPDYFYKHLDYDNSPYYFGKITQSNKDINNYYPDYAN